MSMAARDAHRTGFGTASGMLLLGALLGGLAAYNRQQARRRSLDSSRLHRWLRVGDVTLRLADLGEGKPLVLLHGNGSSIEDFETSSILERASRKYRVLAFDRPGFGGSTRPGNVIWTAAAQADLIQSAMMQLGIDRYLVLGHSFGASVALECALRHAQSVDGVIAVSGYYYPAPRLDLAIAAFPALPVVGTLFRNTLLPPLAKMMWSLLMRKMFSPAVVSPSFSASLKGIARRPSQLRSTAAESGLLFREAARSIEYRTVSVPTGIVAGAGDALIDAKCQAERLHSEVRGSLLGVVAGAGHMVHQTSPGTVLEMIDRIAGPG
jgi:pimeloyl-ACP methyl ester carboxylesterase